MRSDVTKNIIINSKKHFILNICFIAILLIILCIITFIFQPKESYYKYKDFFDDNEKNYDVLFFGSSHAENFFNPMVLWKKYGITSYNFGNSEEPLSVTYWTLKNAIHEKKPKVVVVDLFMYNRELDNRSYYNEKVHYSLDVFHMSRDKISAIYDLSNSKEEFVDKLFTLSTYHSRWKKMDDERKAIDYFVNGFLSYGHPVTMAVESFEPNITTNKKASEINNKDVNYLYKIIELCKSESIDLIFTSTPYVCTESEQKDMNLLSEIINEAGCELINFNKYTEVIDYDVDLYNAGHVNAVGARKVTESLGNILSNEYLIQNVHDEFTVNQWNKKYEQYIKLKLESVWAVDDLDSTLMLLNDEDIDSYICCLSEDIEFSERTNKLIMNIDNNNANRNFEIDSDTFFLISEGIDYDKNADIFILICDSDKLILLKSFDITDNKAVGQTEYVNFISEYLFD